MQDQFEQTHDVAQHRGDIVVLIYGDRKSAEEKAAGHVVLPAAMGRGTNIKPIRSGGGPPPATRAREAWARWSATSGAVRPSAG